MLLHEVRQAPKGEPFRSIHRKPQVFSWLMDHACRQAGTQRRFLICLLHKAVIKCKSYIYIFINLFHSHALSRQMGVNCSRTTNFRVRIPVAASFHPKCLFMEFINLFKDGNRNEQDSLKSSLMYGFWSSNFSSHQLLRLLLCIFVWLKWNW